MKKFTFTKECTTQYFTIIEANNLAEAIELERKGEGCSDHLKVHLPYNVVDISESKCLEKINDKNITPIIERINYSNTSTNILEHKENNEDFKIASPSNSFEPYDLVLYKNEIFEVYNVTKDFIFIRKEYTKYRVSYGEVLKFVSFEELFIKDTSTYIFSFKNSYSNTNKKFNGFCKDLLTALNKKYPHLNEEDLLTIFSVLQEKHFSCFEHDGFSFLKIPLSSVVFDEVIKLKKPKDYNVQSINQIQYTMPEGCRYIVAFFEKYSDESHRFYLEDAYNFTTIWEGFGLKQKNNSFNEDDFEYLLFFEKLQNDFAVKRGDNYVEVFKK